MSDLLRETKVYQEIIQEGHREGFQQGRQEGLQRGRQEGGRQIVVDLVQERFPELVPFAEKQVELMVDMVLLRRLIVKMSIATTPYEAVQLLLTVNGNEKKN